MAIELRYQGKILHKPLTEVVHDFRPQQGKEHQNWCEECGIPFASHRHRIAFVQKMICISTGYQWNRASFTVRQECKRKAEAYVKAQIVYQAKME